LSVVFVSPDTGQRRGVDRKVCVDSLIAVGEDSTGRAFGFFIMHFRHSSAAAACALLACSFACAQTTPLDPMVVTATRVAQPLSTSLTAIHVLDAPQLGGQGLTSIGEALQSLAGVEGLLTGDSLFVRGAEGRMTAVYIDGIRIDQQDGYSNGGGAPWSLIPASQMERIEVLQGPASSLYGSDAMGGVVQLFTRDGRQGEHRAASIGVGSQSTADMSADFAGQAGAWDYAIGASMQTSNGYNTKPDIAHTPETEGWDQAHLHLQLGWTVNAAHHLSARTLQQDRSHQYVAWGGGDDIAVDSALSANALTWTAQWSPAWTTKTQVSQSKTHVSETSPRNYTTVLNALNIDNQLTTELGLFSLGVEARYDTLDVAADRWSPAQAGQRRQRALSTAWSASHDAHSWRLSLRSDDDNLSGSEATYGAAYGYAITPQWRTHIGASSGYRSPTLSQVYDPTYGDPNLKPETSWATEAGLRYRHGPHRVAATLHQTHFEQLISSRPFSDTACAFCWYNVGQARTQGLSLDAQTAIGASRLGASFDVLNAINTDTRKQLNYRSPRKLFVYAETPWAQWHFRTEWLLKSGRWDDAANTKRLPGYGVINLSAKHALDNDVELRFRIDNVADRLVQEVHGLASPGRRLHASVRWVNH
jgi:vitamin B12 transporter